MNGYVVAAIAIGIAAALSPVLGQAVGEARCRRRINSREAINTGEQIGQIVKVGGISESDAHRIWEAIAAYYRLPADRLRVSDRLLVELKECVMGPNNILSRQCLARHRGPAHDLAAQIGRDCNSTLGDLVLLVRQYERELGDYLVRRTSTRDGGGGFVWNE